MSALPENENRDLYGTWRDTMEKNFRSDFLFKHTKQGKDFIKFLLFHGQYPRGTIGEALLRMEMMLRKTSTNTTKDKEHSPISFKNCENAFQAISLFADSLMRETKLKFDPNFGKLLFRFTRDLMELPVETTRLDMHNAIQTFFKAYADNRKM